MCFVYVNIEFFVELSLDSLGHVIVPLRDWKDQNLHVPLSCSYAAGLATNLSRAKV